MTAKLTTLFRLVAQISIISVACAEICHAQTGTQTPTSPPTNTPAAVGTVGGTTSTAPVTQSGPSTPIAPGGKVMSTTTTVTDSSGASMVITGTGNADPFILFDLVAHNPTASTIQFTFFFDIPATDFTASDLLRTHLNIQLTQGSTISPTHTDGGLTIPIFQMFLGNNDDGDHDADDQWQPQNPLLGLGSDVLTAPSTTIFTSVSPAISSIPVFTFSKTYDSPSEFAVPPPPPDEDSTADGPMSAFVQFTLAADSDAEVSGNINFPEPGSMICWTGLGLAFLGAHYWRGRQTAA